MKNRKEIENLKNDLLKLKIELKFGKSKDKKRYLQLKKELKRILSSES